MGTPRAITGLVWREKAQNGGLLTAVIAAIAASGWEPINGTLHVCFDSEDDCDPMPWAATFLGVPSPL